MCSYWGENLVLSSRINVFDTRLLMLQICRYCALCSYSDPIFDLQSNLPRVVALMEELQLHAQLRRFMVVSSGGTVYGHANRLPISEYAETEPVSPYGITKLTIERYALMYHRLHDLPVVVVRPANAYGHGQLPFMGQGFIATAMGNVLAGKNIAVFGERGTVRDYVHAKDVASAMVAALEYGSNGAVYNIGSGVGLSNLDIIDLIRPLAAQSNLQVKVSHEAERKFDVAANVLNFGRLLSCSGWLPKVTMEEGLQEMWQGMRQ
jgi:UDP-glucose 4-epimerase